MKNKRKFGKIFGYCAFAAIVVAGVFFSSIALAQSAPAGFDPARVMIVPYRLAAISGEDIELRIHFKNRYKEVVQADFDLVLSKPDGKYTLELLTLEKKKIILTYDVQEKSVKGVNVSTDDRPKAGTTQSVLTVKSRSGESLYFIFEWSGGKVSKVNVNSSRTGYTKSAEDTK